MEPVRLGLSTSDASILDQVRRDEVELVVLRATLLDMPRTGAARALRARWQGRLGAVELVPCAWHLVTHAADDALPARGTRTLPGDPAGFGQLADTPEVLAAWEATQRVAEALGSRHVVLHTPPGLAPGPRGLRRLRSFVERHGPTGLQLVWQPEGLWESAERIDVARVAGLTLLAPLLPGAPTPPWVLVGEGGAPARLTEDGAYALLECLDGPSPPRALVFGGGSALANLRLWRRVAGPRT